VLADGKGKENGMLTGKNDEGIIVNFVGEENLIGNFVTVLITDAMNWALKGEIVTE
jgi:tRNA-2-methylthio-N6-dimethylallyladenosine synthase